MMDIHPGLIIWTIITFLILLLVLRKFAWKPILSALEHRERTIRESLEEAQRARQEAQRFYEEYERKMKEAHQDAQRVIAKAREEGEKLKEDILEQARKEAQSLMERARRQIELDTRAALGELRSQVAELAVIATEKILRQSLTPELHQKLAREMAEELTR